MERSFTIYATGTDNSKPVVFAMINRMKMTIPTDAVTMARLAEQGVPVINENAVTRHARWRQAK